jgi:hypothetical protein
MAISSPAQAQRIATQNNNQQKHLFIFISLFSIKKAPGIPEAKAQKEATTVAFFSFPQWGTTSFLKRPSD